MARVVVVGYEHVDPLREIVSLSDEETRGDWREWVSARIDLTVNDVDVRTIPTVVPGVSVVVQMFIEGLMPMNKSSRPPYIRA